MKLSSFDKRYLCPNILHVVPWTVTFELKVFNLIIYGEWSSLLWWNSTIKGLKQRKPISSTLPSLSGEILLCRKSDWYVLTGVFSLFELCACTNCSLFDKTLLLSKKIVTANAWSSIAILCGVFMALFKAANFAKLTIKWTIKMRKRHLRNKARELNHVTWNTLQTRHNLTISKL